MNRISVVFFDVKDTLGTVDRPGHLVLYKPTSEHLIQQLTQVVGLRAGIIMNLPGDLSAQDGRKMLEEAGVLAHLDPDGVVINHEVGLDKPRSEIYATAANQMGVDVDECIFVGENLIEVIGAQTAGMRAVLKPFPPGREFLLSQTPSPEPMERDSERLIETVMKEEHLIGRRIVLIASKLHTRLVDETPNELIWEMSMLVWLLFNFIDRFHHEKEEQVLLPFARARGVPQDLIDQTIREHDQGRAYFEAMQIALDRLRGGDASATNDFQAPLTAFVALYREHARKENDELLPLIGSVLTEEDDMLMVEFARQLGPMDISPYLTLIGNIEKALEMEPT